MSSMYGLLGPPPPPPIVGNGGSPAPNKWGKILANQDLSSIVFGLVLYAIVVAIGFFTDEWLLAIAAILLHFYWSVEELQPNMWGALLFWGSAIKQLDNAPVFACKPFFTVEREVRTVFQVIIGTPVTDKKGDAIKLTEEGTTVIREEEPFRVTFPAIQDLAALKPEDNYPVDLRIPQVTQEVANGFKGHPLHSDVTCDPQMVFWFDINDFLEYLKVVPDIKTLGHNITGIAKATLQECAGKVTVGMLIAYNELVCRRITHRIEQLIGEPLAQQGLPQSNAVYWGVNFRGIQISSMGLPRTINEAMRTARAASYEKDKVITASVGEKEKRKNEGDGSAYALQKTREAEAVGAAAQAKVADTGPGGELVLRLQALQTALEKANVTLLPVGELSALGSLLTGGNAILGNQPKKP